MLESTLLLAVATAVAVWLFRPQLRRSPFWRATVTPLASIIGSGFLVAAPLLHDAVNGWSVLAIALIVTLAYGIGGAIRFAESLLAAADSGR
jgi:hypothetical protein